VDASVASETQPRKASGLRVALAEDNDELRELLAGRLRRAGHLVMELEDGFELMDALLDRAHLPDVVVTDVRMPGRSGLSVLEEARRLGVRTPFLVLTAFASEALQEQHAALGVMLVLSKPVSLELMQHTVETLGATARSRKES